MATIKTALVAIVLVNIWKSVALPTVIFLAGLQTIDEQIYESAMIDGATIFQRFRHITLPFLLPTITVNLVLLLKQGFTTFDFPYAMTGGGPVKSTEVIGVLIYNDAFENMRFSIANSQAIILFFIIATILICGVLVSVILLLTNVINPVQFFPNVLFVDDETLMDFSPIFNCY